MIRRKVPLSELREVAHSHGMTVKEFVDYQNSLHMNRSTRRNKSSTYDMGPLPYRKE